MQSFTNNDGLSLNLGALGVMHYGKALGKNL
jgi:hypothetical protein